MAAAALSPGSDPHEFAARPGSGLSGPGEPSGGEGADLGGRERARSGAQGRSSTTPILVLNGPNLNMLGIRQPEVYGAATLDDAVELCRKTAARFDRDIVAFQSNSEGALIDRIHAARGAESGIVFNPGGLTHTSVALRDALVIPEVPIVEVHISNVHAREEFRHHSYISPIATAVIAGMGIQGYAAAIEFLCTR